MKHVGLSTMSILQGESRRAHRGRRLRGWCCPVRFLLPLHDRQLQRRVKIGLQSLQLTFSVLLNIATHAVLLNMATHAAHQHMPLTVSEAAEGCKAA